jgi:uncharacterized protein
MKLRTALALGILLSTTALAAQQTQWTIVNRSKNPKDDSKPNSVSVPDVYTLTGHFDRIVVLRMKYKTDLLAAIQEEVKKYGIRNGVILAAIGSVRGYELHQVSNRTFPSHDTFEKNPTQPADIVSMNGYIINGRVHPHITLATPARVIAGHLEPGTEVFTFADVTIGVMNGTNLAGIDDKTYR